MRLLVTLTLTCAAIFSSPAHAQSQVEHVTGSHIQVPKRAYVPEGAPSTPQRGQYTLSEFARCTIDRSPNEVKAALRMPIDAAYSKAIRRLADSECMGSGMLSFAPILFRGALFAELWRRRVLAESRGRAWTPMIDPFDPSAPLVAASEQAQQLAILLTFADCVIKRDSVAASDIIVFPIGSRQQAEAYTRLQPNLGPCAMQGDQLKFSKALLEGLLAEALYRSPKANSVSTNGVTPER